ncbi:hypothetical protein IM543_20440 [Massilia sp. UMI-21]|nr:hypothetical protein IM543_20440 [Massilia sp. UMI-21]
MRHYFMRRYYSLVAAACLLAAPLASAAGCAGQDTVTVTAQRSAAPGLSGEVISTGTQLVDEVQGSYRLSNGRWIDLIDLDQQLYAEFDHWRRVQLREVGPHLFASRAGDVQMSWMPDQRADTILLSYPADSKGRLRRSCS